MDSIFPVVILYGLFAAVTISGFALAYDSLRAMKASKK